MRFLSICFLLVFAFCTKKEENLNHVARVGDAVLTDEELGLASVFTEKERLSYIDNWINTELLYQAGSGVGLDRDVLLETKINLYRKKLVGQAYLETKIQGMVFVSKDEIRNYYLACECASLRRDGSRLSHAWEKYTWLSPSQSTPRLPLI